MHHWNLSYNTHVIALKCSYILLFVKSNMYWQWSELFYRNRHYENAGLRRQSKWRAAGDLGHADVFASSQVSDARISTISISIYTNSYACLPYALKYSETMRNTLLDAKKPILPPNVWTVLIHSRATLVTVIFANSVGVLHIPHKVLLLTAAWCHIWCLYGCFSLWVTQFDLRVHVYRDTPLSADAW